MRPLLCPEQNRLIEPNLRPGFRAWPRADRMRGLWDPSTFDPQRRMVATVAQCLFGLGSRHCPKLTPAPR